MNELISKQEVLSEIAFAMTDDIPDVQALYDKIECMEHVQPQLNENQQIVLEQLCLIYTKQIYKSSLQAIYIFIKNGMSDAYLNLDRNEASQVLEAFSQLVQEQWEG